MHKSKSRKKKVPKRVLALPDLEHAKTAVLNSLTSATGQRTYEHVIHGFVTWYCSEPRLAFNRTVVLRYRIYLGRRGYAPATVNLRLAAVRRIAYEAADAGPLSPELAAGIRRVKGGEADRRTSRKQADTRARPTAPGMRDPGNRARVAGSRDGRDADWLRLTPRELLALHLESIQQREEHWVIADLVGGGRHVRTVPIPTWAKTHVDAWTAAAAITHGFRAINKSGRVWGDGMSPTVLSDVVRAAAARAGIDKLATPTCAAPAPVSATSQAANWIRSSSWSATSPSRQPNAISGASRSSALP